MNSQKTMHNAAPIQAVLFDLDGTFADTAPDLAAALNHVRALHQLPPLPLSVLRPQASHGSAGLLKVGMNVEPNTAELPRLRDEFLSYYEQHICEQTVLFTGMAELIETLAQRGLPWGIVTNKPHRFTAPLMRALGYAERAACLVSGDTCAHAKPHPAPMLHAAQWMQIAPQHCLYLGDDIRDMQAANAAGMRGIVAAYGYMDTGSDWATWNAAGSIITPLELLRYLPASQ